MTNEIFMDEILTEEQLDVVSGGIFLENRVDNAFLTKFGYKMNKIDLETIFRVNGVKFTYNVHGKNDYLIKEEGGWTQVTHYEALGYILNRYDYPGFTGAWNDEDNVKSFLKTNFGIAKLD